MPNNEAPIPDTWRRAVLSVLKRGRKTDIIITLRARQEWDAATSAWEYELRECVAAALSQPGITGKHEATMPEPGETYAFWMSYQKQTLYAKVCLTPSRVKIKIISAHAPNKGTDRL